VTGSAPVADFYLGPAYGTEPLDVTVYDMSIGIPATWEWSIESPGQAPQMVYTKEIPNLDQLAAGTYRVTLTVANAYGSSSRTRTVTVLPAVQPAEPLSGPTEVTFKCSAGCTCTDPDLPGVTRCSDTPCGADGVKYFYCTKPKPLVTCSGACQCLLESEAIQTFGNPTHVPQRCSSDPCETAGGISKYCYHQGAVTCPAGYQCLSPRAAGWTFRRPVQYSGTVCGYAVDPDTPSVRDPEYCYREG
jgi:PKD repeat protein